MLYLRVYSTLIHDSEHKNAVLAVQVLLYFIYTTHCSENLVPIVLVNHIFKKKYIYIIIYKSFETRGKGELHLYTLLQYTNRKKRQTYA